MDDIIYAIIVLRDEHNSTLISNHSDKKLALDILKLYKKNHPLMEFKLIELKGYE